MSTFAALLIVAVFGYAIYHYLPRGAERAFRLERFHPRTPMSDWSTSYYEDQRRYSDLAAIYGRSDLPDTRPALDPTTDELAQSAQASGEDAAAQPTKSQVVQSICDARSAEGTGSGAARKAATRDGVRQLGPLADRSTLGIKAS
ncbi:hypothetical protein [Nocardia altamirensis]|uniref:hypothetical protein n=1 Tax=Nocardia altamirensis TaxID=472158 RepID=UPI0008406AFE|nr:hypothetical protein [Nocardia altamirensis]